MANSSSGRVDFWDAEKMLDLYVHDYLVKKNMHSTAAIFRREADVYSETPVVIDTKDGFLNEWWTLFYDMYSSRTSELKPQEAKAVAPPVQERTENEQQPLQQRKHARVPEDLPRVPTAVPLPITKQKRSRRTRTRSTDYFSKWLGIPGGDLSRSNLHSLNVNNLNISKALASSSSPLHQQLLRNIAQMQVQDTRNLISFDRTNNIGSNVFGLQKSIRPPGAQDAGTSRVNPGPKIGRPPKVVSSGLQVPNHQKLIKASTAEHQHPPLGNQMTAPPLRQTVEAQQQPDQQQRRRQLSEDGRERRTPSGAGDSHLENMNANEDAPVEENTESFLSYEDDSAGGGTSTPFKASKRRGGNKKQGKGFNFEEICSLHSSMAKVVCCHFSSNGTWLASAGHEKKVLIWNMENFDVVKSSEEHSHLITDVRFRPNSTMFATSSFDKNVKIWDAANPSKSIFKLEGHTEQVMSMDYHPRKLNLLSSCDSNDEIRLWNVNQSNCTHIFKGATKQVRFQPRFGKYLAAASGNSVNIFDVETASFDLYLKGSGHAEDVLSICWDTTGKYLATVSEDSARIWSTASSGKCIYELQSNGNKFQSCIFHPGYSLLLIIGCYQSFELWSPSESDKTMTVPAHKGLISALAASPKTDMVASGSHDQVVKLWK
ncbi:transcriptional corepressor LEUNIG-like [Argentina anserina]|uniref:transcriptional corepressor LEUNIG-like n=1 Tax=Argentina anserina TaxID=57926 RepID=UPI00217632A3|nr:transcriptional corepressor LEUNIG-like [Potentilla anserina]